MFAPAQKMRRLQAGDNNRAHFRMLETNPLDRVSEFDIDAQVVRIQFQLCNRRRVSRLPAHPSTALLPSLQLKASSACIDRATFGN
jgi:hypothetical protein